jgi:hypothetical protein
MSIVLVGSTSGSCTLQEQAVAGTTVLTLPTVSGTVLTDTSPKAGNVLQVVSANYSTQTTTSSSTYSDTGLSVSITPSSSSSKILVFLNLPVFKETNNTSGFFKLVRNSTDLITIDTLAGYTNSTASIGLGSVGSNYLDSPATTSSTTYKVQFKSANNNAIIYINSNGYGAITSTITAMEIAA